MFISIEDEVSICNTLLMIFGPIVAVVFGIMILVALLKGITVFSIWWVSRLDPDHWRLEWKGEYPGMLKLQRLMYWFLEKFD